MQLAAILKVLYVRVVKIEVELSTTDFTEGPERTKRLQSRSPVSGLTVPKTPNFESNSRSRPIHVPSQKELEEKEIEEMKKCV